MSSANKELIRRYVGDCIGKGDVSLMDELFAPGYVLHMNKDDFDVPAYRKFQPSVLAAFPDGRWVIEDILAEGDRVAWRYSFSGTHRADFMGFPASGKLFRMSGMVISRIVGGRIAEEWETFDAAEMSRQLGGP